MPLTVVTRPLASLVLPAHLVLVEVMTAARLFSGLARAALHGSGTCRLLLLPMLLWLSQGTWTLLPPDFKEIPHWMAPVQLSGVINNHSEMFLSR